MADEIVESLDDAWAKAKNVVKDWGEDITSVQIYTPHGRIDFEFSQKTRQHEAGWRIIVDGE